MGPNPLSPYLPMMRRSPQTMALWILQKGLTKRELTASDNSTLRLILGLGFHSRFSPCVLP